MHPPSVQFGRSRTSRAHGGHPVASTRQSPLDSRRGSGFGLVIPDPPGGGLQSGANLLEAFSSEISGQRSARFVIVSPGGSCAELKCHHASVQRPPAHR
ncbi:MAG: hypothetical protein MZV70_22090 [Desulfobacterales bacterium]|nr:hypothetical protein [Desulfobacterales bacterium]